MMKLAPLFRGLLHLFFPRLCIGCEKALAEGENLLCLLCEQQFPFTNYHHIADNETALRLGGRFPFVYATSLAYFTKAGLLQHLVHGLKYQGRQKNARYLGAGLAGAVAGWGVELVVPVPLHRKKLRQRGFNQSQLLAEEIARLLQLPLIADAIVRVRYTESQTEKSREQRVANVAGAFEVRRPELLTRRHILLVDDVLTTGATIEACASALCTVPAIRISIATAGIAV